MSPAIRASKYFGLIEAHWKPEHGDAGKAQAREWVRKMVEILKPYMTEELRYTPSERDPLYSTINAGYGATTYAKLGQLKLKYDPTNFFKNNANVPPGAKVEHSITKT